MFKYFPSLVSNTTTALGLLLLLSPLHAADVKVHTGEEMLNGRLENGINIFRGIPFAQPPVQTLRWQAPQPPIARDGIQDATQFAAACMQTHYNTEWYQDVMTTFDADITRAPVPRSVSEDCLYLNIWSPDLTAKKKLAVMVFIHGGNNQGGWSYEPNYLSDALAAKGVIVVTIAYRMHVFGFMAHPELSLESASGSSGNYGLLDQIAALKWVNQHIEHFGGDANNITLFGESAGAANIGALMLSPLADGLYKNAIRQSGTFDINYRDTLKNEEVFGEEFTDSLGLTSIKQLRYVPADKILEAAEKYYLHDYNNNERSYFYAAIDNNFLSDSVANLYKLGKISSANVLLGNNADEKLMYTMAKPTEQDLHQFIDQYFKPGTKAKVLSLVNHRPSLRAQLADLKQAWEYSCTAQTQAAALSKRAIGDIYRYYFTRQRAGIGGERIGVYHGAELPYVFNTHDSWLPTDATDTTLTATMMNYWVNFAKTGNPNGQGLTQWPRYNTESRLSLELGDTVQVIDAPDQALCQFLKSPQP
ncbi:MAG TPA: carboxylesterase [Porticoccus sp.]|nr:carboxylesterase [Porticoccus sp.]